MNISFKGTRGATRKSLLSQTGIELPKNLLERIQLKGRYSGEPGLIIELQIILPMKKPPYWNRIEQVLQNKVHQTYTHEFRLRVVFEERILDHL